MPSEVVDRLVKWRSVHPGIAISSHGGIIMNIVPTYLQQPPVDIILISSVRTFRYWLLIVYIHEGPTLFLSLVNIYPFVRPIQRQHHLNNLYE